MICNKCGKEIHIKFSKCMSCSIKAKWNDPDYRNKSLKTRSTEKYKTDMKISMQKSKAWKDTQHLRTHGLKKYWENIRGCKFEDIKDVWYMYRRVVYNMTESNYKKFMDIINPGDLPRGLRKYHVDHKYSILEGFKNNIPPYVISNPHNLQMLKSSENIRKDFRCDITKKELFTGFDQHVKKTI